ncbi:hypothetical protein ACSHWO_06235 [Streptomyces sp. HUAS TT3]|uniref:hypothetical protein n=1 Tax=Streptomyces sp. HUAS TT3 TaxID=3447510 RepID=UPI003F659C81
MAWPSSCSLELRRRAVRMVAEVLGDHPAEPAALKAVAQKPGAGTAEALSKWVRQDQTGSGRRPTAKPRLAPDHRDLCRSRTGSEIDGVRR